MTMRATTKRTLALALGALFPLFMPAPVHAAERTTDGNAVVEGSGRTAFQRGEVVTVSAGGCAKWSNATVALLSQDSRVSTFVGTGAANERGKVTVSFGIPYTAPAGYTYVAVDCADKFGRPHRSTLQLTVLDAYVVPTGYTPDPGAVSVGYPSAPAVIGGNGYPSAAALTPVQRLSGATEALAPLSPQMAPSAYAPPTSPLSQTQLVLLRNGITSPPISYAAGERVDFVFTGCLPNSATRLELRSDLGRGAPLAIYPAPSVGADGYVRAAILLPVPLVAGTPYIALQCVSASGFPVTASARIAVGGASLPTGYTVVPWEQYPTLGYFVYPPGAYVLPPTDHMAHTGLEASTYLALTVGLGMVGAALLFRSARRRAKLRY